MTGIVILAAGASTRLGQPKQSLVVGEKTLLQTAISAAVSSTAKAIVVVLGANGVKLQQEIANEPVTIIQNSNWEEGMSSSIRLGVAELTSKEKGLENIILMVSDQPFVNSDLLTCLIAVKAATAKKIVASAYNDTLGVPVLFDQSIFPELMQLKGEEGAKKILFQHKELVAEVSFEKGSIDIDTTQDYERLIKLSGE